MKAHTKKWGTIAVERDLLEPIQRLATAQGLHGYELMRRLVRDEVVRVGDTSLAPISQTDVPDMIRGLVYAVRTLAETQTRVLEELAKMQSDLTLLDRNSFIAIGKVHKALTELMMTNGLALSALDQLVRPGIKDKIIDQASELSKREWPKINDAFYGGRLPKDL